MSVFNQASVNYSYVKVRWQEPYVSAGLNAKTFGVLRPGVYEGFTINPGSLSGRDIVVGPGFVPGGIGSGLNVGYTSGCFDSGVGYSIAVYEDPSGFNTTVQIPQSAGVFHLDATGQEGKTLYVVLGVTYAIGPQTTATLQLVDGAQIDANPWLVVIGYVQVPSSPSTPLNSTMFGYNDPLYPRLTPLSTPGRAGYMPASAWGLIGQNTSPWQGLLVPQLDPNNQYLFDISPSQGVNGQGNRIYSYVQASVASRFPRDVNGNYNGGPTNSALTKLNLKTGTIGGAHQVATNQTFAIPSVSGTANAFQVGFVALDGADNVNVIYGGVYTSASGAMLDSNLPVVGSSLLQVGGWLLATDVSGNFLPLGTGVSGYSAVIDRRPFINVGGGGGGGATPQAIAYGSAFQNSIYTYMNQSIFSSDGSTFVGSASTGSFNLVSNEFYLPTIGSTFVSTNNLCSDFYAQSQDINDVYLTVSWDLSYIDSSAIYELSRDGGNNYQIVSMTQIDSGDTFVGRLNFANTESLTTFSQNPLSNVSGSTPFSSVSGVTQISQPFTLSASAVIQQAVVDVNKVGSPGGNLTMSIVKDNGSGQPSPISTNTLCTSAQLSIGTMVSGLSSVSGIMPTTVLQAGNYHLVLTTDSIYQSGYVSGVTELDLSVGAVSGTALLKYLGSWVSGTQSVPYLLKGRPLDLRFKVISGTNSVYITAYNVMYGPSSQVQQQKLQQQNIVLNGNSNTNVISVTNFLPNPYLCKVYWQERGIVFTGNAFTINGQNISFAPNTFNLPGETITLLVDQSSGGAVDTSDANAANIFQAQQQLIALGNQLAPLNVLDTVTPLINVPYTTIVNRAQIVDPSKSLSVNFGVNRIMTQNIFLIQNEFGPAGQTVWGIQGDPGYIRIVSTFPAPQASISTGGGVYGPYIELGNNTTDYIEVTFYGTGLNMLDGQNGNLDYRVSIDGGAEGSNFYPAIGTSAVIAGGEGFAPNSVIPVVSGLTLGLHTAKIRNNAGGPLTFYGFEIVTATTQLQVTPGGYFANSNRLNLSALTQLPLTSGFSSGTLGTTGGRVAVYLNPNGTVQTAVNPNAVSPSYYPSVSHTNEEPIRTYDGMEFCGAANFDFAPLVNTGGSASFVLDDGTTNLIGKSVVFGVTRAPWLSIGATTTSSWVTFTFVGTGVDFWVAAGAASPNLYTITLDGTSTVASFTPTSSTTQIYQIASGLPYGTHVLRIQNNNNGNSALPFRFIVYQPKKPAIPTGSVLLADYNVMATFVADTNVGDPRTISTGVLRKGAQREFVYSNAGSWTLYGYGFGGNNYGCAGAVVDTGSPNTSCAAQITFFGTGFDLRMTNYGTPPVYNLFLNGVALTLANFPTISSSTVAGSGSTFNSSIGQYSMGSANDNASMHMIITGLPVGTYTLKMVYVSGAHMTVEACDIITPIHSIKINQFDTFNTSPIGSCALKDDRQLALTFTQPKALVEVVSSHQITTTSGSYVPMPDLSATFNTGSSVLDIFFSVECLSSSTQGTNIGAQIFVDGVGIAQGKVLEVPATTYRVELSDLVRVSVSPGVHRVQVYWYTGGGTATRYSYEGHLSVREV